MHRRKPLSRIPTPASAPELYLASAQALVSLLGSLILASALLA